MDNFIFSAFYFLVMRSLFDVNKIKINEKFFYINPFIRPRLPKRRLTSKRIYIKKFLVNFYFIKTFHFEFSKNGFFKRVIVK